MTTKKQNTTTGSGITETKSLHTRRRIHRIWLGAIISNSGHRHVDMALICYRENINISLLILQLLTWYMSCNNNCWLGVKKSIWPVKTEWWVLVWLSVWSKVQTVSYSPAYNHPQTPSSPASFKSRLVLPFWYWLTQVVLKKGHQTGIVVVVVVVCRARNLTSKK